MSSRTAWLDAALPAPSSYQKLLQDRQWWPPEKLLAHQAQALSSLVAHAHRTVLFHRDRIEASGLGRGRSLDLEGWRRLPVLTRRDLQRRRPCPTAST